jgi:hypothetical protein
MDTTNKSVVDAVLERVSLLALEDWGMCMVEPREAAVGLCKAAEGKHYLATMTFKGVLNGSLFVLCPRLFMESLCRNLLGLDFDEEVSVADAMDALRELTNVLSGNFLTQAYGEDTVFELIYPNAREADDADIDHVFSSPLVKGFEADDQFVAVALGTHEAAL